MFVKYMNADSSHVCPFKVDGSKIIFDDVFEVDCAIEQKEDIQTVIDIKVDGKNNFSFDGNKYVATIIIPPKSHSLEVVGGKLTKVENPFNIDSVQLNLFKFEKAKGE